MATSQDVIERLGGDNAQGADMLTRLDAAADSADAVAAGSGSDISGQASALAATLR